MFIIYQKRKRRNIINFVAEFIFSKKDGTRKNMIDYFHKKQCKLRQYSGVHDFKKIKESLCRVATPPKIPKKS